MLYKITKETVKIVCEITESWVSPPKLHRRRSTFHITCISWATKADVLKSPELGVVAHTCNSTLKVEIKVTAGSPRPAWATV